VGGRKEENSLIVIPGTNFTIRGYRLTKQKQKKSKTVDMEDRVRLGISHIGEVIVPSEVNEYEGGQVRAE